MTSKTTSDTTAETTSTLPLYVERGGEQVYEPPFLSQGVQLYGFVFEVDPQRPDAPQQVLDTCLNTPSGGAVNYRAATPFVLLTFAHMGPLRSLEAPDSDKGFFEYDEAALWMLTMAMNHHQPNPRIDHLALYIPYMFAELSQAMCCGREIYGYPKQYGWVQMPQDGATPQGDAFSLETVGIKEYGPNSRATRQPLFEVRRVDGANENHPVVQEWHDAKQALAEMLKLLRLEGGIPVPSFDFFLNLTEYALHSEALMVYLKQFRDAASSTRACYQSIVEAPGKVENIGKISLLPGEYQLGLQQVASHPISDELGLKDGQKSLLSFYIEFDLGIELGKEVWKAN